MNTPDGEGPNDTRTSAVSITRRDSDTVDLSIEEQNLLDEVVDSVFEEYSYIVRRTVKDSFIDTGDVAFLSGWIGRSVILSHKFVFDHDFLRTHVRKKLQEKIDLGIVPPRRMT